MSLTPATRQALAEAALVLQHAQGFVFLPLLVSSERAAVQAWEWLHPALGQQAFRVPWPVGPHATGHPARQQGDVQADVQAVLNALDAATSRLPHGSTLLLDASSSTRQAAAQNLPVLLNQRREDWRRCATRLVVLWPQAEREALMQGAPDLWSMRAAAPWIEEEASVHALPVTSAPVGLEAFADADKVQTLSVALSPAQQRQWQALQSAHTWADADVSPTDALALVAALHANHQHQRALALVERLLSAPEAKTQPPAWRGALLDELAVLRALQGDRDGALAPAREAVAIYRCLAQGSPEVYVPDLAGSLNNLASRLSETGDRQGALLAAQESVEICRRLAQLSPAAYEPLFARSLNNLSNRLREIGDLRDALVLVREAVEIYRRLARANPEVYEPDLIVMLKNLVIGLNKAGDPQESLALAREAAEIGCRLAQANPAA